VQLDAYESDLAWLHFGQEVRFSSEAYPGEVFTGRIAFIDPVLNPKTRTVRVRVNMENPDGKLKPEMFVNAIVRSQVVSDGKVMNPELAGKWISPMHPEIVRDEPGDCPVCGMALVSAESLGYVPGTVEESAKPLVIPASAPLITGKRAVVYLASKEQPGVFEGRVIELGPRAGDQYIVKSGLEEGDLVVSHGAFKIDSAVQILAKPSMMNPANAQETGFETPIEFRKQLDAVVTNYFGVSDALGHDDFEKAKAAVIQLEAKLAAVDMMLLTDKAHMAWMANSAGIKKAVDAFKSAIEIASARDAFDPLSNEIISAVESFGLVGVSSVFVIHCPMASGGKGADWLQPKRDVENPYMGSKMFTCGSLTKELEGIGAMDMDHAEVPAATGAHQHNH
jgi:Cu(I)/Ag(I) efflux system membrane fusion protein